MPTSSSYGWWLQCVSYLGIFLFVSLWNPAISGFIDQALALEQVPLLAGSKQPISTPNRPVQQIYDFTMRSEEHTSELQSH